MKLFKREKKPHTDKNLIERARDLQESLEVRRSRIGKGRYGRVLKMARKPTNEEFSKTSKITFLGMLLVGGLGFAIFLFKDQVAPWILDLLGYSPV